MKFLIDAQLPRRLAHRLRHEGHDALHTLDLTEGNRAPDRTLASVANRDGRVLVTKDADFVNSHLLSGRPSRLLLISTGNISNTEMGQLLVPLIPALTAAFQTSVFVELTRSGIIVRG